VQQQLTKIGITYPIRQLDDASTAAALAAKDYDFYQWTMTRADPDVLRAVFSSHHTAQGYALMPPSQLDTYLDGQLAAVDSAKRAELVRQAQEYIVDGAWGIPINSRARTFGLAEHAHGLRADAESKINLYDAWVESS
jgi:peptide/nickel transport system substrate-binding protein